LSAEWEKDWKEADFEGDLKKLQKEAEKRLDDKIAELMANIETTGAAPVEN
jgi:mRNA-degrading endonuclease RelE of RelBE toxin-antitoxin system